MPRGLLLGDALTKYNADAADLRPRTNLQMCHPGPDRRTRPHQVCCAMVKFEVPRDEKLARTFLKAPHGRLYSRVDDVIGQGLNLKVTLKLVVNVGNVQVMTRADVGRSGARLRSMCAKRDRGGSERSILVSNRVTSRAPCRSEEALQRPAATAQRVLGEFPYELHRLLSCLSTELGWRAAAIDTCDEHMRSGCVRILETNPISNCTRQLCQRRRGERILSTEYDDVSADSAVMKYSGYLNSLFWVGSRVLLVNKSCRFQRRFFTVYQRGSLSVSPFCCDHACPQFDSRVSTFAGLHVTLRRIASHLHPSFSLRSSSNLPSLLHDVKGHLLLPSIFLFFAAATSCLFLVAAPFSFFFVVVVVVVAVVGLCACRGCSKGFRVLFQLWCLVYDKLTVMSSSRFPFSFW